MSNRARTIGGGYAYDALRVDAAISDRLSGATLRRAILRAWEAGELNVLEIAAEFGCNRHYVHRVIRENSKP